MEGESIQPIKPTIEQELHDYLFNVNASNPKAKILEKIESGKAKVYYKEKNGKLEEVKVIENEGTPDQETILLENTRETLRLKIYGPNAVTRSDGQFQFPVSGDLDQKEDIN